MQVDTPSYVEQVPPDFRHWAQADPPGPPGPLLYTHFPVWQTISLGQLPHVASVPHPSAQVPQSLPRSAQLAGTHALTHCPEELYVPLVPHGVPTQEGVATIVGVGSQNCSPDGVSVQPTSVSD